jgi:hypothetical protein
VSAGRIATFGHNADHDVAIGENADRELTPIDHDDAAGGSVPHALGGSEYGSFLIDDIDVALANASDRHGPPRSFGVPLFAEPFWVGSLSLFYPNQAGRARRGAAEKKWFFVGCIWIMAAQPHLARC